MAIAPIQNFLVMPFRDLNVHALRTLIITALALSAISNLPEVKADETTSKCKDVCKSVAGWMKVVCIPTCVAAGKTFGKFIAKTTACYVVCSPTKLIPVAGEYIFPSCLQLCLEQF